MCSPVCVPLFAMLKYETCLSGKSHQYMVFEIPSKILLTTGDLKSRQEKKKKTGLGH